MRSGLVRPLGQHAFADGRVGALLDINVAFNTKLSREVACLLEDMEKRKVG